MRDQSTRFPHHHVEPRLGLEERDRHKEKSKDDALAFILKNKIVGREHADRLLEYWRHNVHRSDEFDNHGQARMLVDGLKKDLDLLKELRLTLKMHKEDPTALQQLPGLQNLIRMLEVLFEQLEKRWWLLRRKAWAYIATLNPAFPRRHLQHEKPKDKKDKAQEATAAATKKRDDE